jgi:hypothetical protein
MNAKDLVGVWLIETFDLVDLGTGQKSQPWGRRPKGTVVFHADGRMVAIIHASPRTPPAADHQRSTAFQQMLAYSGHYRVDPPDVLVTSVDISWFEPWIGTKQIRYGTLDGDELVLTSAPLDMPRANNPLFAVVRWRRETS